MERTFRKWTAEEDEVLLRYIKAHPENLHKSFTMVSEHLTDAGTPRTVGAVAAHWYTNLSKRPDVFAYIFTSSKHWCKNRKNGEGQPMTQSLWRRIFNMFKDL